MGNATQSRASRTAAQDATSAPSGACFLPLTGPDSNDDALSGPLFWFHELAGNGPWKLVLTDEEWNAIAEGEIQ